MTSARPYRSALDHGRGARKSSSASPGRSSTLRVVSVLAAHVRDGHHAGHTAEHPA